MPAADGAILVQYVFCDVVRFTEGRTTEAQVEVIAALNAAVRTALEKFAIPAESRVLLPTGDGIAVALLQPQSFDLALRVAEALLERVHSHNSETEDHRRQFQIRVGVNQNIDNLVTDINGNQNVAGRGINQAQRIMSNADGSQLLVSESIYDILCEREAYQNRFRQLPGKDKHGNRFKVYQLVHPEVPWLSSELPIQFQVQEIEPAKLSDYEAHFVANALAHREFLLNRRKFSEFDYVAPVFLHLLSLDSMNAISRSPFENPTRRVQRSSDGSPYPCWNELEQAPFWVRAELSSFITDSLSAVSDCFEKGEWRCFWAFPSVSGEKRLRNERPDVAKFVLPQTPSSAVDEAPA